ncbi:MAG: PRC-barrel domain-containing protein [Sphingomonas fennica]
MEQAAGWIAPAATMIAAMMTAANLGARITGWGFVVFTVGSLAWVTVAATTGQANLLVANGFLTIVNLVGIWRWLGRRARYDAGGRAAAAGSAASADETIFPLSTLEGRPVHGRQGGVIGHVVDVMGRCQDGAISYLIVRTGGVGGVGETLHAIGRNEARIAGDRILCDLDAATLAGRPALDAACWPPSAAAAGAA